MKEMDKYEWIFYLGGHKFRLNSYLCSILNAQEHSRNENEMKNLPFIMKNEIHPCKTFLICFLLFHFSRNRQFSAKSFTDRRS